MMMTYELVWCKLDVFVFIANQPKSYELAFCAHPLDGTEDQLAILCTEILTNFL